MKNKCPAAIEKFNMLSSGDTVVVGVSGGADSMALLHYMHENANVFGIRVIAAHFNHGIRGEEADRDQTFVEQFCKKHSIVFFTAKEDVPQKSKQMQKSIEECARTLRYDFLQSVYPGAKIATAHTNSDSCESFLFNFARGTGLKGLCGIPPVRDNIIRPLIFCSAEDTRKYCKTNGIDWCEDSSNGDDSYARNSIRHNTVPALKRINDQFEDNALRCMHILQCENDFLNLAAVQAYHECVSDNAVLFYDQLSQYHEALKRRVLLQFIRSNGCKDVSQKQIERLLNAENADVFTLNGGIRFKCDNNCLFKAVEDNPLNPLVIKIAQDTENVRFFDSLVLFKKSDYNNETQLNFSTYIDADKIADPVLRTRKAGDAIRLKDRKCTKTIKQLFTEKKIPVSARLQWPVLADEHGVIWIGGFGIDESRLADQKTKNYLMIEWRQPT